MKTTVIVFIFLFINFHCFTQTVQVLNKNTFDPVEGVIVITHPNQFQGVTNIKGKITLDNINQTDTLFFHHSGFKTDYLPAKEVLLYKDTCSSCNKTPYLFFLSPKNFNLQEVIISASKFQEKKEDIPQQIEVITSRIIRENNPQSTADALQNSGLIFVQKSQMGGGSPVIRGFETNKILLVVDGIRMNNAIYRGGHLQNIITVDNEILQKMEIIYGPGSVMYGSDALGGVIHMLTKNPFLSTDSNDIFTGTFMSRFSTANSERSAHIDFNYSSRKWASLTSFSSHFFGDLRQGNIRNNAYGDWGKCRFVAVRYNNKDSIIENQDVNIQRRSGYNQYDMMEKIIFTPNKHNRHLLNLQFSTTSDIPRYDRLSQMADNDTLKYADWYYGPQRRFLSAYNYQNTKPSAVYDKFHFIVAYQNIEESRHSRKFNINDLNHRIEHLDIVSLNADWEKNVKKNEIRFGLDAQYNNVLSTAFSENILTGETSPLDTRYPDGGSTMLSLAGYVTHTTEISDKFLFHDGLRYSFVSLGANFTDTSFYRFPFNSVSQRNSAFNGNIGFVFKPSEKCHFSINAASGFRAPNIDDISKVFDSQPGEIIVPNPNLKPEYAYTGDFSISKIFGNIFRIQTTTFYTLYKDAITTQPFLFNGQDSIMYEGTMSRVVANINAKNAYIYGFSLKAKVFILPSLFIASSVNYTYGRIRTDTVDYPLDHIPPAFGRTSIRFTVKRLQCEFYAIYNAWKHKADYNLYGEDNFSKATPYGTPAWYTLNLRTSYRVNSIIELQILIENILDINYRPFASGISAPGRNLIVAFRANF
ncbi:MAG TPA: TonB-dependent receptor [Bacteroidales bacterium]|nr:TonB-dependent receptor [Bacteroidales bacterium]